jgi:hypothetical protein
MGFFENRSISRVYQMIFLKTDDFLENRSVYFLSTMPTVMMQLITIYCMRQTMNNAIYYVRWIINGFSRYLLCHTGAEPPNYSESVPTGG